MSDTETVEETEAEATPAVAQPALPAAADDDQSFWHRPLVEQWLVPLVLPLLVIGAILVYVLNVSRLFLAGHGAVPTIVGTVLTVAILIGASWLAKASNLKSSQVALITVGSIAVIAGAGWLMLGPASPKEEASGPLPVDLKTTQELKILGAPGGNLAFEPSALDAQTGLAKFDLTWAAPGHAFIFTDKTVRDAPIQPSGTEAGSAVAFFAEPGEYEYICPIPGHAAAGMKGVVNVTGNPTTIEKALTDAGNSPEAAAGGGE